MRTLKISAVATLATILAWRAKLPQKTWPSHPQLAFFLLAIVLCLLLQIVWSDTEPEDKKTTSAKPREKSESEKEISKS